jgi:hypothetical protein
LVSRRAITAPNSHEASGTQPTYQTDCQERGGGRSQIVNSAPSPVTANHLRADPTLCVARNLTPSLSGNGYAFNSRSYSWCRPTQQSRPALRLHSFQRPVIQMLEFVFECSEQTAPDDRAVRPKLELISRARSPIDHDGGFRPPSFRPSARLQREPGTAQGKKG